MIVFDLKISWKSPMKSFCFNSFCVHNELRNIWMFDQQPKQTIYAFHSSIPSLCTYVHVYFSFRLPPNLPLASRGVWWVRLPPCCQSPSWVRPTITMTNWEISTTHHTSPSLRWDYTWSCLVALCIQPSSVSNFGDDCFGKCFVNEVTSLHMHTTLAWNVYNVLRSALSRYGT